MSIKLEEQTEARLSMQLAEGLQPIVLSHDFITFPALSWVDGIEAGLEQSVRITLDRYCGEPGLKRFIYSEIGSDLMRRPSTIETQKQRLLVELDPLRNPIAYARSLVSKIKTLPLRYRVSVALPIEFSDPILSDVADDTELGNGIRICRGDSLPKPFPMSSDIVRVNNYLFSDFMSGAEQARDLFTDRLYFTMPILGYASHHSCGELCRSFEDYLKAFYGAGLAEGLFSTEYTYNDDRDRLPYISVHNENTERELVGTEKLEQELLDSDYRLSTGSFADAHVEDIWAASQQVLQKVGIVFSDDKDARKLFTACIWFYRASISRRLLDKLLESTIAIEVLLGDRQASEGVGLGNLLGNRCTFLLGRTSQQRQNILSLFSKIYKLRSDIVHEGRHKLEPGERATVNAAVELCGRIISREMEIRKPSTQK